MYFLKPTPALWSSSTAPVHRKRLAPSGCCRVRGATRGRRGRGQPGDGCRGSRSIWMAAEEVRTRGDAARS